MKAEHVETYRQLFDRLDTLSFFAQSVANRLAEELEDMFHGI